MARKVETLQDKVVSFLGKNITQEESVVTVHIAEMKCESMLRLKRAQQALYDFLTARGCDTPTMSPLSTTVNVNYIIGAMKKFLKATEWIFSGITPQFTLPVQS
jgi:hypothetical protein